jgi:asparagine synthase (glutamine-hydrolysing)
VLTKVDRASMAQGLEVRPPLLDNSLIDFAFSIRASARMNGGRPKALLKRACVGLLPEAVIHRRKKGFAIPLAQWIAGPLLGRVRDVVASSPVWQTGLLDRQVFAGWLDEHLARSADRSRPLWAAVVLDAWYRSMAKARGGVAAAVRSAGPASAVARGGSKRSFR